MAANNQALAAAAGNYNAIRSSISFADHVDAVRVLPPAYIMATGRQMRGFIQPTTPVDEFALGGAQGCMAEMGLMLRYGQWDSDSRARLVGLASTASGYTLEIEGPALDDNGVYTDLSTEVGCSILWNFKADLAFFADYLTGQAGTIGADEGKEGAATAAASILSRAAAHITGVMIARDALLNHVLILGDVTPHPWAGKTINLTVADAGSIALFQAAKPRRVVQVVYDAEIMGLLSDDALDALVPDTNPAGGSFRWALDQRIASARTQTSCDVVKISHSMTSVFYATNLIPRNRLGPVDMVGLPANYRSLDSLAEQVAWAAQYMEEAGTRYAAQPGLYTYTDLLAVLQLEDSRYGQLWAGKTTQKIATALEEDLFADSDYPPLMFRQSDVEPGRQRGSMAGLAGHWPAKRAGWRATGQPAAVQAKAVKQAADAAKRTAKRAAEAAKLETAVAAAKKARTAE